MSFIPIPPTTGPYPLNHPRILWDNVLRGADSAGVGSTINTVSSDNVGLMTTDNTAERAAFAVDDSSGFVVLEFEFTNPINFDTFCIGSHNLRDFSEINLRCRPTISDPFTTVKTWTAGGSRKPFIFHSQTELSAELIQLRATYSGTEQITWNIGHISAGVALQVARPHYDGNVQSRHYESTKTVNILSERGVLIGRNVYRQGSSVPFELRNVTHEYYVNEFQPFVEHAKTKPFYYAWNLLEYPDDVDLCTSDGDLVPSLVGQRDFLELSTDFRVII